MTIDYNKIRVRVRLDDLAHNYQLLNKASGNAWPVVKSDAYGHGLIEVSRRLATEGADTFCVGTAGEGAKLRTSGALNKNERILCLLGAMDSADAALLLEHDLIPFVPGPENLGMLAQAASGTGKRLRIALKFDTGMARLGFRPKDVPVLAKQLRACPELIPAMASSHLACADNPDKADTVAAQMAEFQQTLDFLAAENFEVEATLANSAGILGHQGTHHHAQRAGIAMYGVNPLEGTAWAHLGQGLRPAMDVDTPVIQVHDLARGRSISYGHTYTADKDMRVAIVAAGYADGYSRSLSGRGRMGLADRRVPILGRVCMQMTAVDVTGLDVKPGDRALLLGGQGPGSVSPGELAEWWGTIAYEPFCLLGMNPREYVK